MRNSKYKTTTLSLTGVFLAAMACIPLASRVDWQSVSAASGPPHSVAFHSASVINPDGSLNTEIYVMDPDGGDQTRLTFDPRVDQQPDISPNGRQIVYCGNRITDTNPEGDFELFLMDPDGGNMRQLTFNAAGVNDCWPRWSPNGRQIVFHSNVDGNFEIYVIDADGTNLTRVTDYSGIDQFPEWSPNGKQLVFRRDTDVYVSDVDGSNLVRLTDVAGIDQMASWSPNGKQIAFMSFREGYCAVYLMNSDGSGQTNLMPKPDGVPNDQFCSRAPAWSRNGRQIYFSSFRPETDQYENIFVMDADGGNVRRLTFDPSLVSVAAVR